MRQPKKAFNITVNRYVIDTPALLGPRVVNRRAARASCSTVSTLIAVGNILPAFSLNLLDEGDIPAADNVKGAILHRDSSEKPVGDHGRLFR